MLGFDYNHHQMTRFPIKLREAGNGLRASMRRTLYNVAVDWHDGQSSALYCMLSTNSIESIEHLDLIMEELDNIHDPNATECLYFLEYWRRDYLTDVHYNN